MTYRIGIMNWELSPKEQQFAHNIVHHMGGKVLTVHGSDVDSSTAFILEAEQFDLLRDMTDVFTTERTSLIVSGDRSMTVWEVFDGDDTITPQRLGRLRQTSSTMARAEGDYLHDTAYDRYYILEED